MTNKLPEIDKLKLSNTVRNCTDSFEAWRNNCGRGGWYEMPIKDFKEFIEHYIVSAYSIGLKSETNKNI